MYAAAYPCEIHVALSPPSDDEPRAATPTTRNCTTGPRVTTPIMSPTPTCCFEAVFRSIAVPLKAAIMNLLSIGAAYGVIVAVFQ